MQDIIFDDIGSFPIPETTTHEWMKNAFLNKDSNALLFSIINDTFQQKIDAGVQVPTYPQFQDMNLQFLDIINDDECVEEPFKVKEDCARILELEAIEPAALKYKKEHGKKLEIRICVTGPIELYLRLFGGTDYTDVLNLLATSIDRFVKNSIKNAKNFNIKTIAIDEPSIGINPQIMFEESDIISALTIAGDSAIKNGDVEIHLHSPLEYTLACESPSINVVGIESASTPSHLELIDKQRLEQSDTFLRVGIARTDIFNLTTTLNEKYGVNVWKETKYLSKVVTELETPSAVKKRCYVADSLFGDCIKYVGPDCGLGSWPSQDIASQLLNNVSKGIEEFKKGN